MRVIIKNDPIQAEYCVLQEDIALSEQGSGETYDCIQKQNLKLKKLVDFCPFQKQIFSMNLFVTHSISHSVVYPYIIASSKRRGQQCGETYDRIRKQNLSWCSFVLFEVSLKIFLSLIMSVSQCYKSTLQ